MAGRQGEGQLLGDGRTAVLECFARYGHELRLGPLCGTLDEPGEGLVALPAVVAVAESARERELADERVEAEEYAEFLRRGFLGLGHGEHLVGQLGVGFAAECQFGGVEVDAGHEVGHLLGGELAGEFESDGLCARLHRMQGEAVGLGYIAYGDGLVDAPAVVAPVAPDIGEFAALLTEVFEPGEVFGPVVRADVESLVRAPYQFLLVVGPLEVGRNHLFPLLGAHRRELGEQLLFRVICHNVLYEG